MATTDHPLVLDLGNVRGMSVYEEWTKIEGNEDKTFEEFLEYIADLGIHIDLTNVVEEDNPNAVTSGGVWAALFASGQTGGGGRGSASVEVFDYSLGDDVAPDGGPDLSGWIDDSESGNGVWTLSPDPGQEWHIDNGGTATNSLVVALPDAPQIGDRVRVYFRPDASVSSCTDPTISAGGVLLLGEDAPNDIGAVALECASSPFGWLVVRHYADGSSSASLVTRSARIVYSGANRASTASMVYDTAVAWSGESGSIPASKSATLRRDIFRKLYNKANFRGWTTNKAGSTVTHADGATVSMSDGQTLTLYPLYSATDVAVNLGKTTAGQISTAANASAKTETIGTYTFSPGAYITGFKGEAYSIKIYGTISSPNNHTSRLQYKVDNGNWTTICERTTANSSASDTKVVALSGTGSHAVSFRVYQEPGTQKCTSTYRCYVSAMTIQ